MVSKATTDQPSRATSLALVAGALALDFANTASGRGGPRSLDQLRGPEDLIGWAVHAGIVGEAAAAKLRAGIASGERGLQNLFAEALTLREAVFRVGKALADGAGPAASDLSTVKTACARAIASAELAPTDGAFGWTWPRDPPDAYAILGPLALSAAGLLRDGDLSRLKQCPGEHCGWLFFDLTKNRRRRWCEMSVCGNRAKAKRFAASRAKR